LKNGQHRLGHTSQGVETELGFSLNDNVAFSTAAPEPAFLGVWGLALIGLALAAKNFRAFIVSTRLLGLWKAGRAKACASILLLLGLISGGAVQASACTYTVSPLTLTFTSSGGSAPIVVQTPAGCPWFAQVAESFLTMRLASSPEKPAAVIVGERTQEVVVTITPNFTSRVGYIVIAGHTLTVEQTGVTVPPVPPPAPAPPPSDCGATSASNYRVSSNVVFQDGIYREYPFEVENGGAVDAACLTNKFAPLPAKARAMFSQDHGAGYLINPRSDPRINATSS
jgi:hypothetical protein